jgi:hypothetical protein
MDAVQRGFATIVLGALVCLGAVLALSEPAAAQATGICGRTAQVQTAILGSIRGISACADVTAAHLRGVRTLLLIDTGLTSLKAGDFAGLSSLENLDVGRTSLRLNALPAGLLNGLRSLRSLTLPTPGTAAERVLPAGFFAGLSGLERVRMRRLDQTYGWEPLVPLEASIERVGSGALTAGTPVELRMKITQASPFQQTLTWQVVALTGQVSTGGGAPAGRVSGSVVIEAGATYSASFRVTASGATPSIRVPLVSGTLGTPSPTGFVGFYLKGPAARVLRFADGTIATRATINIAPDAAEEGEDIEFPIRLSAPAPADVELAWSTADGTATAADDYHAVAGRALIIPKGQTKATIRVRTKEDAIPEPIEETFTVTLTAAGPLPAGVALGVTQAIGTIGNDDTRITETADVEVVEGGRSRSSYDYRIRW